MIGLYALEPLRVQAPILIVLAPLIAAAVAALSPSGLAAWLAAILGALAALAIALLAALGYEAPLSVQLGGWPTPLGVEFVIDGLSAYGLVVVAAIAAFAFIGATAALRREVDVPRQPMAAALASAALAGAFGLIVANDLFALFGFLQWIWLALASLIALGIERDRRAGPAAFNVLILGVIGAVLFAFGAGMLFLTTGATAMDQAAGVLNASEGAHSTAAGLALMAIAVAMVAGVAPLNAWSVGAFARGHAWVSLVLGAALPAAGALTVARLIAFAASATTPGLLAGLTSGLIALGVFSALIASAQALAARDLRRLTIYILAAQTGCVLIGFSAATGAGIAGALFHLANQTAIGFVLFAAAAALGGDGAASPMSALDGLFKRAPFLSIALSVSLLSLIGAPMTAGFLSRWSLLQATLEARMWWGAAAIMLSSLAAIIYAGQLFARMFARAPAEGAIRPAALALAPSLALVTLITLAFGFNGAAPLQAAEAAAASLSWSGR
jgi:multicomponent Na+:H+ antiporter subunit D